MVETYWSGRADLAGKCPTSFPEAIRFIRMASRPVRPAHLLAGVTRVAPYSSRRHPPALPQELGRQVTNLIVPIAEEMYWSGRADLNGRPPAPKAGALTRLRYAPTLEL